MTRMFTYNGKRMVTWNPFTGCNFNCSYCWARKLAETKLKASYPNGFIPTTHPDRFNKRFKPNDFVFVCSMGDISFAPSVVWNQVYITAQNHPDTKFLLCTKNPLIYQHLAWRLDNVYYGITIETNRPIQVSKAPSPETRYGIMILDKHPHKFISIEPIMDFDLAGFVWWIEDIAPEIVEVGADNYNNNLPEPEPEKVERLLSYLKGICPIVIEKPGLERLFRRQA